MDVGHFGCIHHLIHGHLTFVVTVHDVLSDGAIEKHRLLGDNTHLTAYVRYVDAFNIEAI